MSRRQPVQLAGARFGRLAVIEVDASAPRRGGVRWICRCDCGSVRSVRSSDLQDGGTASCGCSYRHGHSTERTPTYFSWSALKARCANPNIAGWERYGGRGITVCERWRDSFKNFLADMGERPPGTSIDRIDNNGNYEPGNCRWATHAEQARNKRRRAPGYRINITDADRRARAERARKVGLANRRKSGVAS